MPCPKCQSQMRLTMLRQVSGLSARVIHWASAARRALSGCSAARLNSKFSFSKIGSVPGRTSSRGWRILPRCSTLMVRGLPPVGLKLPCGLNCVAAAYNICPAGIFFRAASASVRCFCNCARLAWRSGVCSLAFRAARSRWAACSAAMAVASLAMGK